MRKLMILIIGTLLVLSTIACESKKTESKGYQVVKRLVKSTESIINTKGVISYGQYALILTQKDKIYGLDTENALIAEYNCNLANLDEFIILNDSVLMVSGDSLYSIKEIADDEIIFEKYEYKDGDSFSLKYQINEFDISSCCHGEWGGSVYFEDSVSKQIYSTESTCLMNIDTLNGEIYLFNYLAHHSGFTSIFRISDIRSLPNIEKSERCNWYYKYYDENYENRDSVSSILLGNEDKNTVIFDTIGFPVHHGFVTNEGVNLIHSSQNKLSLFSISKEKQLELETELVEFEEGQRIQTITGGNRDKVTISCSNSMGLKHVITIDKNNNLIELFEIN